MKNMFIILLLLLSIVAADEKTHIYAENEFVSVFTNRIGPYANPRETYKFALSPLSVCTPQLAPGQTAKKHESILGLFFQGDDLVDSLIPIQFLQPVSTVGLCSFVWDENQAHQMEDLIQRRYWYQFHLDDLPMWGMFGEYIEKPSPNGPNMVSDSSSQASSSSSVSPNHASTSRSTPLPGTSFLYTHRHFLIEYNGSQIVAVTLTSGAAVPVQASVPISLTYSVEWRPSETPYVQRLDRYLSSSVFAPPSAPSPVFVPIVATAALIALIWGLAVVLRRRRLSLASTDADLDLTALLDDHSWQLLHNDVFRAPSRPKLLSVGIGVGLHAVVFAIIAMPALARAYAAHRHPHTLSLAAAAAAASEASSSSLAALRASAQSAIPDGMWLLVCGYALAGILGSAIGATHYKLTLGTRARAWRRVLLYTVFAPVLLGLAAYFVMLGATTTASADKLFRLALVWSLVHCPLSLLGAMVGRGLVATAAKPSSSARPVPRSWVTSNATLLALACSMLPLAVAAVTAWVILPTAVSDTPAPLPSSPSLICLLLCQCAATAAAAVTTTTILLAHGSWHWHWPAALTGSTTPITLLLLVSRFTAIEPGTVPVVLVAVLAMGATGYLAALVFVHMVYKNKRE